MGGSRGTSRACVYTFLHITVPHITDAVVIRKRVQWTSAVGFMIVPPLPFRANFSCVQLLLNATCNCCLYPGLVSEGEPGTEAGRFPDQRKEETAVPAPTEQKTTGGPD